MGTSEPHTLPTRVTGEEIRTSYTDVWVTSGEFRTPYTAKWGDKGRNQNLTHC